jgi:hypothetical protein
MSFGDFLMLLAVGGVGYLVYRSMNQPVVSAASVSAVPSAVSSSQPQVPGGGSVSAYYGNIPQSQRCTYVALNGQTYYGTLPPPSLANMMGACSPIPQPA